MSLLLLFNTHAHPLDGVRAKLDRAKENIVNLESEMSALKGTHPNLFRRKLDSHTGTFTYNGRFTGVVPSRLSVLTGEILYQLRSSLDHVVAQLLIKANDPSKIDAILERSGFPIYSEPTKYQSYDWTKIPNIKREARQLIDRHQPCNRRDGLSPDDHPLAVLASLNNIDKHRLLLKLTGMFSTTVKLGTDFIGDVEVVSTATIGPGHSETELVRAVLPNGTTEVDMDIQAAFEVAFENIGTGKPEPVIPTLQRLFECVSILIADFRRECF